MLIHQTIQSLQVADYQGVAVDEQLERIHRLAPGLKGMRVIHVNSTANGGGVAEILQSLVPLMRDIGLDAQWHVIPGSEAFFNITKRLHNLLQGAEGELSPEEMETYVAHVQGVAEALQQVGTSGDIWVMHDPQSLPLAAFLPPGQAAIWVCHIDTTTCNKGTLETLLPWFEAYRLLVFSLPQYVFPQLDSGRTRVIPPAIDALHTKNIPPDPGTARAIIAKLGIDPLRPLMAQVSRFDTWKDPWGVIDCYRMVKKEMPGVQLALLGVIAAQDDPEAFSVLDSVRQHAGNDPDIHLYADGRQVGHQEVAAVQSGADVVLQKSLREGFGLSVAEAQWKSTPVIGGNCGGIRLQIVDGETGFLVDSVEQCARRVLTILGDRPLGQRLGQAGKERVRQHFLMPRLLADYLESFHELKSASWWRVRETIDALGTQPIPLE